ncbi:MAG: hypothetical protein PF518_19610 [Spirochaetaceae bacterium]|nr:hypothetical protein [Spirochaetaceae bacterium]
MKKEFSCSDEIRKLKKQIAIYHDMIQEIEKNNHFEANPEVLIEMDREYKRLVERYEILKEGIDG